MVMILMVVVGKGWPLLYNCRLVLEYSLSARVSVARRAKVPPRLFRDFQWWPVTHTHVNASPNGGAIVGSRNRECIYVWGGWPVFDCANDREIEREREKDTERVGKREGGERRWR